MVGRIPGTLKLVLFVLVLFAPLAAGAADPDIATLRVSSVNAVVGDLERLADTLGIPVNGDEVLDGAMAPLRFPGLALVDRTRPAALVFPARGLAIGTNALAGALPVSDVEAALLLLEERFDTHGVNESTHTFTSSDGTSLVVRAEEGYLAVGFDPAVVDSLDLAAVLGGEGLPPGNISLEIYLEPVAPVVQAGLLQGRQMVQMQMEAEAARRAEEEAGEPEEVEPEEPGGVETPGEESDEQDADVEVTAEPELDPEAIEPVLDLYFDFLSDAINNVSRLQISIEVTGEHMLFHKWVTPRAESTLAGLVAAQTGGFPDLARFVDPEGALMVMAGQVTRTPEFDTALTGYAARYMEAIGAVLGSLPDQEVVEQFSSMMEAAQPLIEQSMQCYRGDMAAVVSIQPETGMRMTQVMGVNDPEACRVTIAKGAELISAIPVGEDGEQFLSVTEDALSHAGVTATRTEVRFLLSLVEEAEGEEFAELMRSIFGGDSLVSYQGLTDEHLICTSGIEAEQAFMDTVDRIGEGGSGPGLTAAHFAPFRPGPGAFAAFDLGAFFELVAGFAEDDEEQEAIEMLANTPGRMVYGGRFSETGLELGMAFPLETLAHWGEAIAAAAAEAEAEAEAEEEAEEEHEDESDEETEHHGGDDDDEAHEISIEIGG